MTSLDRGWMTYAAIAGGIVVLVVGVPTAALAMAC